MILALLLAAAGNGVAVLPVDVRGDALEAGEVASLEQELRVAVRGAGLSVIDPAQSAAAPRDPRKALEALDAAAVIYVLAARSQGATLVVLGVYKSGSSAPAGSARLSGGIDELKQGVREKLPPLLKTALALEAPATEPPPRAETPRPADPLLALVQEVTAEVESLRGLRRKSNFKVQIADDKLYATALRARAQKEIPSSVAESERARWSAFGLAPASADPARLIPALLDEQSAAFYDPFSKLLTVRKDAGAAAEVMRLALAREIEHGLQDQIFGYPDVLLDHDARLARLALYEGDALAVMTAYGARRSRKPVKAAVLNGAAVLKAGAEGEPLLRASGHSPALLKAPAVVREETALRFAAGFALVAEVYRRGGFALVDRMFANPPASSHQVLHPEAYLYGEAPLAIAAPSAPRGTRAVASGRLGELGARLFLAGCVDKSVARDAASRWAGDAYIVVQGSRRARSLVWTSAWSGGGAEAVANLARLQSPCWQKAAGESGMAAAARVRTGGDFVALARGSVDLDAAAAALSARTGPVKAVPPLGDLAAAPGPARIEEGRFSSAWLALEGAVPDGFQPDPNNPTAEISIQRAGAAGGSASLSLVGEALAGDPLEKFFETAAAQIGAAQGGRPTPVGKAQRTLADGSGEERSWKLEGANLELRIQVGAFCGGKASLALVRLESSEAAKAALDRFASSIRATGAAPACAELE